jgi:phosphonate transport system permease protein
MGRDRMVRPPPIAAAFAATSGSSTPPLPPRPASGRARWIWVGSLLLLLALLVYSWINVGGSLSTFISGMFARKGLIRDVLPSTVPPDLSALGDGVKAAVTTFCIAVLSIAFGVVFSIAMLPLAARNITPSRSLYEFARLLQAILRAIPELIMLLMFNVVMGFSPFSSVLALSFHGIGVKGKLFAEAVEEMDMSPVDALRVAGAGRIQVFLHAVLPGVRNTLLALTLYRLDANFRSAVTLGAVGGGGIGFLIDNELNIFQYKIVLTYLIVLVIFVLAIERVSTILRERLM